MRRKLLVGLAVAGATAAAAPWFPMVPALFSSPSTQASQAAAPEKRAQSEKADARFAALPARAPLGEPRGALFYVPAPAPPPVAAAPERAAAPTAPPMPYRVAGTMSDDGVTKVVLMKGDAVLTVQGGETLDGGYRVESVGADEIVLVYMPLDVRERLPLASRNGAPVDRTTASAGSGSRAAQLRWEGPERVQAGSTFNVTLKVTSHEALRASPLQLSYDAKLLEPVAVRPGNFYGSDAFFSYRVNRGGAIFVGASGSGGVASDAELLILSFKSLRPVATTEVKISSLQLQGAVGKALSVEPFPAYRTSIAP